MNGTGLTDKANENLHREITQEYLNFLDDSADDKINSQKIEELVRDNGCRLIVDINDVRRKLPERANRLIHNFVEEVVCLENALKEAVTRADHEFAKGRDFHVGFEGSFGDRHVNPRSLKSEFLGNLVCCESVVTKCSLVRSKIVKSLHYCSATKKTLEKRYTDFTSYEAIQTNNAYPKEDENKNPLETEIGLCVYKDHQTLSIQELPENAPAGHLPRSVDVIADDDLADRCKPGDRVHIVGLFRVLPNKQAGMSSGNFRAVLIANNIRLLSKERQPNFEQEDIKNIRQMSRQKGIFELLARSLAPSIYGHDEAKKAILCLLLGGTEKLLENGTRLRGDINVLMIGDPSVAKSQLLRYVMHMAPRVVATTGRGSSGVGLTAAVVQDSDTGERRLEAGAMVLADRGIVCIDEFDKMSDIDRTAIHEVMEQGRVSIAKAGIHAKLNARSSVLAAANPVYGRYNLYKTPMENIGMQDSLLSRFDLIFVMLDEHNVDRDKTVAENVLKLHRYRTPGEPDGTVLPIGSAVECYSTFSQTEEDGGEVADVFEKNREWTAVDDSQKILSIDFMRKYIHMAKAVKPKLSEAAGHYIAERYAELRSADESRLDRDRTMPVTARQLETLIRLSTAMAKARLAKTVDLADAKHAYELLYFACFKEKPKERLEAELRRRHVRGSGDAEMDEQDDENNDENIINTQETVPTPAEARASRYGKRQARDTTAVDMTPSDDVAASVDPTSKQFRDILAKNISYVKSLDSTDSSIPAAKRTRATPAISVDRYKKFKEEFRKAIAGEGAAILAVRERMQTSMPSALRFTDEEFEAAFEQLQSENICMIIDDEIMLI